MDTIRTLNEARQQIQQSIFDLFKGLTFGERLTQGALMALQAVCGACLAYTIGRALHTEQAVWAAVTAIAVTQHNYSDTMSLSRDQFIGAMIGGLVGFAGAALGGDRLVAYAIAVAVTIISCWCLNVGSAARLGGVTATIVLLFPGNGPLWDIPLMRLGEVALGTVCALTVCWAMSRIERRWLRRAADKDKNK
ncbi:FUSC family protein [Burkholderia diffusa]|uniref:FUSC family protein n=1 Tax=Burkholderia diffusa TaxID=488732 RepID=UPI002652FE32|nr:FUSC family protein [Burkholderia diffusa]MDN7906292.1 FUSC family protein [Burkholderia diffusa]